MRTNGTVLVGSLMVAAGLAACDGSPSPHPSSSSPAPVAIRTCAASVTVPPDTTLAVPSAALPPTAVIPAGAALTVDLPSGFTVGLGAPVQPGAGEVLCRAPGSAETVTFVGRQPGFVRLAVASTADVQRTVNVRVTV